MKRIRLVLSGSGGQGVITAAVVLAEAAVLHEGLLATQTQSYGPEARGGATRSDVIISDSPIYFPKVVQANFLVCLTREAYMKYFEIIRPGGILLTDTKYVNQLKTLDCRQVGLPLYQRVMEEIGKPIVYSSCVLGAILGLTAPVKPESVIKVLETRIPPALFEANKTALNLGLEMAGQKSF